jgi:hypothetical protein
VDSEPPAIVFEEPAPCSDTAAARALLARTLAPARAPRGAWTVTMRVTSSRAEGEITDDTGAPVAHRVFVKAVPDCSALARAIGVWASLVLDAELHRLASADADARARGRSSDAMPASLATNGNANANANVKTNELPALWPAPAINEKPSPEQFAILRHAPDARSFELGVASFLMGGTGTGALAGPALFAVVEISDGIYLRPTLAFGRTLEQLKPTGDVYGTWGITRFDACLRIPGFYRDRRGMQLDTCAGADVGFLHFDRSSANASPSDAAQPRTEARTIPFLAFGPAMSLRGELGNDLAAELRGVVGFNVVRESFQDQTFGTRVDPPMFGGRVEVGLPWRVR